MSVKGFSRGKYHDTSVKRDEISLDTRMQNIVAAKAVADAIRTSLGPRGMDKMIINPDDHDHPVTTTNDGATIVKKLQVTHPCARMFVELSKAQDVEAGDGTTSVVVIAGSLLSAVEKLMAKGIHPTTISDSFKVAHDEAVKILRGMSEKVDLSEREQLIQAAKTSLYSKVVSQHSDLLAPMAVESVLRVIDSETATNVDLKDIKIVKKLGTTMDQSRLIGGLVFPQGASSRASGPTKTANAKIALIQFCLSPPKTDMDHTITVTDYNQIDRIFREERKYILNIVKKIKKSGCNVLLIQKSILRDAVTEMSLHLLAKMKIMVVKDIERVDVPFFCKTLNIRPIANLDSFTEDKLGFADLVQQKTTLGGKIIEVSGIKNKGRTVTCFLRATNTLILDEAERSLHDALCVVRSLVKEKYMIAGGGAPEIELSIQLQKFAKTLHGVQSVCVRSYGEAFEVIPTTLAENAGLSPIRMVTELRNQHAQGKINFGINVKKAIVSDMKKENVIQPLLVNLSSLNLSTEVVRMILKIDGVLM